MGSDVTLHKYHENKGFEEPPDKLSVMKEIINKKKENVIDVISS